MQELDIYRLRRALDRNYILVLTTNSLERTATGKRLADTAKVAAHIPNDGARLGICEGHLILHLTGTSGAQADKSVGRITRRLLGDQNSPKPKAVILLGISWGDPDITELGSVILSADILAINQLRFDGDEMKYVSIPRASPWHSELEGIAEDVEAVTNKKVRHGTLASGEQYNGSTKVRTKLLTAHPHLIGGEMEGWDLVPDLGDIPWLQLRGVSDFAENFVGRINREIAVDTAADCLPPLVRTLEGRGLIEPASRGPETTSLLQVLSGNTLEIAAPMDGGTLNYHLNDRIAPALVWRLADYSVGLPLSPSLPRVLTNFLLEISQNALRHGRATRTHITFHDKSVVYEDDGQIFDVFSLTGERGGKHALDEITIHFIENGSLAIQRQNAPSGNRYTFDFLQLSARLREARRSCKIIVGVGQSAASHVHIGDLFYDDNCQALFFDGCEILMSSRLREITDDLREVLESGKQLFIQCADEHEKAKYEDALGEVAGDRLHVFVSPRTSVSITH